MLRRHAPGIPLTRDIPLPPADARPTATPIAPDPAALERVADRLLAAERPLLMCEFTGRSRNGFDDMVTLAETVGAPDWDENARLCFPSQHPLNLSLDKGIFADRDLVVALDTRNWEKPTTDLDGVNRTTTSLVPDSCDWIDVGFGDIEISAWSMDYERLRHASERVTADTALAIPMLADICRARVAADSALGGRIDARAGAMAARHRDLRATWREDAKMDWDASPLSLPRLASEVWEVIRDEDWVLSANTLRDWTRKLWNFDRPYRHAGSGLGTAAQIGISIGVALANRDKGRPVVDIQPDGDLMFDLGALWVAAKYKIPMLVVMFNNRAYYNDWEHQIRMARQRGTDENLAHLGMDLFGPEPDFAGVARSLGWFAEGPLDRPEDVGPALRRAVAEVKTGRPALVDTITRHR